MSAILPLHMYLFTTHQYGIYWNMHSFFPSLLLLPPLHPPPPPPSPPIHPPPPSSSMSLLLPLPYTSSSSILTYPCFFLCLLPLLPYSSLLSVPSQASLCMHVCSTVCSPLHSTPPLTLMCSLLVMKTVFSLFQSKKPDHSVMQALENLSDNQVRLFFYEFWIMPPFYPFFPSQSTEVSA